MAEIRCPNCGKSNPATQELCQFCYTRLLQTGDLPPPASGDDLLSLLGGQEAGEDVPDWLRSLRPEDQSDLGAPEPGAVQESLLGESDLPLDWLSSLGEESFQVPAEQVPAEQGPDFLTAPGEEETTLDWLIQEQEPAGGSLPLDFAQGPGSSSGEQPDWLSRLGTDDMGLEQDEKAPTAAPLSEASQPGTAPQEQAQPAAEDDWLSSLQGEAGSPFRFE